MNSNDVLNNFFRTAVSNEGLTAVHISLFLAIYHLCADNGLDKPLHTSRRELMGFSKIKSLGTYHRILKDIVAMGFITYSPSYHPGKQTKISLVPPVSEKEDR